jgi:hypothetical protein
MMRGWGGRVGEEEGRRKGMNTTLPSQEICCSDALEVEDRRLVFNRKTWVYIISIVMLLLALLVYPAAFDPEWKSGVRCFFPNGVTELMRHRLRYLFHFLVIFQAGFSLIVGIPGVSVYPGFEVSKCKRDSNGDEYSCTIKHDCNIVEPYNTIIIVLNTTFDLSLMGYFYLKKKSKSDRSDPAINSQDETNPLLRS